MEGFKKAACSSFINQAILNHTSPGDPDVAAITEAIASIREALKKVNHETGNADNALKLRMLHDRLIYKSHHTAVVSSPSAPSAVVMNSHDAKHVSRNWKEELQLLHPSRRLLRSGALKRKHGADLVDLEVFLLDTHLVLTRRKQTEKGVEYRLYREVAFARAFMLIWLKFS